mmetsp:Transcript_27499/g.69987  ORF Transcript_27499/g.69987 Transcript_27499/m.69987 type:complete len:235 (-) Transcript_27499:799-1503(-)
MLEALNTLNPSPAVLMIMPGICVCQWISFRSCWPACRNSSCAGRSSGAAALPSGASAASSSGSLSSARSHTASWLSAPLDASMEPSYGHHSRPVTGPRWKLNCDTAPSCEKDRRSQMRSDPSSAPVASMYVTLRFQLTTLTSLSCACTVSMGLDRSRVSHTRTVLSTLPDTNTVSSVGDHAMSSTLASWPAYAPLTAHLPASCGSHTTTLRLQSPVASRPALTGDQSTAYPSMA